MKELVIRNPLDMHIHFRQDIMMALVTPLTSREFSGALVMPNTKPEITTKERLDAYYQGIKAIADTCGEGYFEPFMTLFFQTHFDEEFLETVEGDIFAIKLYPKGMTTGSDNGVDPTDPEVDRVLAVMEEMEIRLCVHAESPGYVMDREHSFLPILRGWLKKFPKLKITMEHITTQAAVRLVGEYENLSATVTIQHLVGTTDDLAGGLLNPHWFCKPILKRPEDRRAIRHAVFGYDGRSIQSKIMFGSDSAPHDKKNKISDCGCAGCFTAPISLPVLAQEFHNNADQEMLQRFVSDNAMEIYSINPTVVPKKQVTLVDRSWTVQSSYGNVVPLFFGDDIGWSVKEIRCGECCE